MAEDGKPHPIVILLALATITTTLGGVAWSKDGHWTTAWWFAASAILIVWLALILVYPFLVELDARRRVRLRNARALKTTQLALEDIEAKEVPSGLVIHKAFWGVNTVGWDDCLDRVRGLEVDGRLDFTATRELFGGLGEPSPQVQKRLSVVYQTAEMTEPDHLDFPEGTRVVLPPADPTVEIHRVMYGAGNIWADVTKAARNASAPALLFEISSETFRTDPAPGEPKSVSITYSLGDGEKHELTLNEGDVAIVPPPPEPEAPQPPASAPSRGTKRASRSRLKIYSATIGYGTASQEIDVTQHVQRLSHGTSLNFIASYETLMAKPNAMVDDVLYITWGPEEDETDIRHARFPIVSRVLLPPGPPLHIIEATYGEGGDERKITEKIRKLVAEVPYVVDLGDDPYMVEFEVSNEVLLPDPVKDDPAPNRTKRLVVTFRMGNGPALVKAWIEGEYAYLPPIAT